MKIATGRTTMIIALLFIVSCTGAYQQVPLVTLVQEADSREGESVTLGGCILDTKNVADNIYMTVLQTPLGFQGKPQAENTSEGNFLVVYSGALDLNDYRRKRQVTVTGKIAGIAKEDIDNCPRPCLKIESSDVKVWPEKYRGRYWGSSGMQGGAR